MSKAQGAATTSTRLHGHKSVNLPAIILTTEKKYNLMANCNIPTSIFSVSDIHYKGGAIL